MANAKRADARGNETVFVWQRVRDAQNTEHEYARACGVNRTFWWLVGWKRKLYMSALSAHLTVCCGCNWVAC